MDAATRRRVRERADDRCEYCRLPQFVVTTVSHGSFSEYPRPTLNATFLLTLDCRLSRLFRGLYRIDVAACGKELYS
ncbi:MAG: hypothetical protein QGF59_19085, partial [Pirellulaceae bacterium]|nr:hypothetical protein [Pirellulaceae bacterium]